MVYEVGFLIRKMFDTISVYDFLKQKKVYVYNRGIVEIIKIFPSLFNQTI